MTDNDPEERRRKAYEQRMVTIFALVAAVAVVAGGYGLRAIFHTLPEEPVVLESPIDGMPPTPDIPEPSPPSPNIAEGAGGPNRADGIVTQIVTRDDPAPGGGMEMNYYARTEYYMKELDQRCYFHYRMGADPNRRVGDSVIVAYTARAADACGTSTIIDELRP